MSPINISAERTSLNSEALTEPSAKHFFAIFVPTMLLVFVMLALLFEAFRRARRGGHRVQPDLGSEGDAYEDAHPHVDLYNDIDDNERTGSRIYELNELSSLLDSEEGQSGGVGPILSTTRS